MKQQGMNHQPPSPTTNRATTKIARSTITRTKSNNYTLHENNRGWTSNPIPNHQQSHHKIPRSTITRTKSNNCRVQQPRRNPQFTLSRTTTDTNTHPPPHTSTRSADEEQTLRNTRIANRWKHQGHHEPDEQRTKNTNQNTPSASDEP